MDDELAEEVEAVYRDQEAREFARLLKLKAKVDMLIVVLTGAVMILSVLEKLRKYD